MVSVTKALGAFALAWVAVTAYAAPVEVILDVTVTRKTDTDYMPGIPVSVQDPAFLPMSFTTSFRFDPELVIEQTLFSNTAAEAYATIEFDGTAASAPPTPVTAALRLPEPDGGTLYSKAYASHFRSIASYGSSPNQAMPLLEVAGVSEVNIWRASGIDGPDTNTLHLYERNFGLRRHDTVMAPDELAPLTGEDAVSFLQAQVGMLLPDAFLETAWLYVTGNANEGTWPVLINHSVRYTGDVVVRSVSTVPEPDMLTLGILGLMMMAARFCARHRPALHRIP